MSVCDRRGPAELYLAQDERERNRGGETTISVQNTST